MLNVLYEMVTSQKLAAPPEEILLSAVTKRRAILFVHFFVDMDRALKMCYFSTRDFRIGVFL